ncbi:MAG: acyltransferase domain-containing protein [Cyanobacteria bacterium P01_F01_bin.150]
MNPVVVWMFSGLGSQRYNMGKDLFDSDPIFRQTMVHCDEIVTSLIRGSMLQKIYPPKGSAFEAFTDIRFAVPALFSVQYSLAKSLMMQGHQPDYLVGYSLGELVAYVLADVLDLQDGLYCMVSLAAFAHEYCQRASMVAILDTPQIMHQMEHSFHSFYLAAINFNTNFVVTGPIEAEKGLLEDLRARGITAQTLPVEYGFHSQLIDPMKIPYCQQLEEITLHQPQIEIVSVREASRLESVKLDDFWTALRYPIDFRHTIAFLNRLGNCKFIDLGPSGTMANFLKYDGRLANSIEYALI